MLKVVESPVTKIADELFQHPFGTSQGAVCLSDIMLKLDIVDANACSLPRSRNSIPFNTISNFNILISSIELPPHNRNEKICNSG
jgi:hypothetical protein